jgi:HAD superfamily hydrolase (TIGR01662 family)
MGRYSEYFKEVWKLQANRKVIGLGLFNVLVDNTRVFTPGDAVMPVDGVDKAIQMLSQKGYDFIIITGQPSSRTRALEMHDFENIITGARQFIEQLGGRVRNVYYAPGTDKNDPYVRPNTGMWERAASENNLKWDGVYFVGSETNDVKASTKMKAIPVLIKTANSESKLKAFELTHQTKVKEFSSLLEFANSLE